MHGRRSSLIVSPIAEKYSIMQSVNTWKMQVGISTSYNDSSRRGSERKEISRLTVFKGKRVLRNSFGRRNFSFAGPEALR